MSGRVVSADFLHDVLFCIQHLTGRRGADYDNISRQSVDLMAKQFITCGENIVTMFHHAEAEKERKQENEKRLKYVCFS